MSNGRFAVMGLLALWLFGLSAAAAQHLTPLWTPQDYWYAWVAALFLIASIGCIFICLVAFLVMDK